MNMYGYVWNSPNNYIDPYGLMGGRFWIPRFSSGRSPNPGITRYGNSLRRPPGWNENWQWRAASREHTDKSWWNEKGGEWTWHEDIMHKGHWDYNPWDTYNGEWQNIYPSLFPLPIIDFGNPLDNCSENPPTIDWDECFSSGLCA